MQIADVTTTTTHKTLRGPRGGLILARKNDELTKKFNSLVFPWHAGWPADARDRRQGCRVPRGHAARIHRVSEAGQGKRPDHGLGPADRSYKIVSGGTDNHMFLVDLVDKDITGKDADAALGRANITVNKNAVPKDPRSPFVTSGLRLGTPAITTRGFGAEEVTALSGWIADILDDIEDQSRIDAVREKALQLCQRFPVYSS